MPQPALLAIDQGTTSTRAMVFTKSSKVVAKDQQEFVQIFPHDGWVEHNPEDIWDSTLSVCRNALSIADRAGYQVASIGITNQRETVLVWDRKTGSPIYNAIVWQDRRTAEQCRQLRRSGHEAMVKDRTGLLLDPYFSATKLAWILDNTPNGRERAERGELLAGTIDTFLIWRLTGGRQHVTDATNASRTSLYNITDCCWDPDLLGLFSIPAQILPQVKNCVANFGTVEADLLGHTLPIGGVAGDQQAAAIGQGGFQQGDLKSTYGTGGFVLLNTGSKRLRSNHRLLSTVGYQLENKVSYALEGSIFVAGAAVQWLRDGLGVVEHAADTEAMASKLGSNDGTYLVPAFTGLGAPHWDPDARGALFGLTRDTSSAHLARAALESVVYQTSDLLVAMAGDGVSPTSLKVDGGMVANNWLCQFLADILNVPVLRPAVMETTALGAAYLAGLSAGIYQDLDELAEIWRLDQEFAPEMTQTDRHGLLQGWQRALERTLS